MHDCYKHKKDQYSVLCVIVANLRDIANTFFSSFALEREFSEHLLFCFFEALGKKKQQQLFYKETKKK